MQPMKRKRQILIASACVGAFVIYQRDNLANMAKCSYHSFWARSYANKNRIDEAMIEFDKISHMNPPTYLEKAEIYKSVGNYPASIAELDNYITYSKLDLVRAIAKVRKAEALAKMKKFDDAIEVYFDLFENTPYNKEELKSRISLMQWQASEEMKLQKKEQEK